MLAEEIEKRGGLLKEIEDKDRMIAEELHRKELQEEEQREKKQEWYLEF